ncbi:hypothetical protein BDV40DRAFT_274763 [Aspergillus tamarii]|uniref:Fatty acid hydroxylase domain-containing protein n=1 Tax=Aspergillus tamarii TaxID=41984 RepID=A0A5N6UJL9_ASPTM|nr:hypothetical protein BDV40DRAFT_274763 [Aspergillus tamarii]
MTESLLLNVHVLFTFLFTPSLIKCHYFLRSRHPLLLSLNWHSPHHFAPEHGQNPQEGAILDQIVAFLVCQ